MIFDHLRPIMRLFKHKSAEQAKTNPRYPYVTLVTSKENKGIVCSCVDGVEFFFSFKEWSNDSLRGCLRSLELTEEQAFCILAGMDLENLDDSLRFPTNT